MALLGRRNRKESFFRILCFPHHIHWNALFGQGSEQGALSASRWHCALIVLINSWPPDLR